jgi:PhzF family phenazine biosynthesis protein
VTRLHLIDAFAESAGTGNPAGVVLLETPRPAEWMQTVAMEMNQAETAFLQPQEGDFGLRWFTPVAEVDLCGHATLAAAHFLWDVGVLDRSVTARFVTRSGVLTASSDAAGWITLDFPAITSTRVAGPADLADALGATPVSVWMGDFDLLVELADAEQVRTLTPNLAAIARWDMRGVLVTAPGDVGGVDFVSRCFFPALGVPEDPVTGSAHCALTVFWRAQLGRDTMTGWQASRRGGMVRCVVRGDRVELAGRAITTLRGELAF